MEHEQSDKTSSKKVGGGFSLVAIGVTSTAWVAVPRQHSIDKLAA